MANKTIALEASDASISTATISIKVVQVGKRQLTQSTFRQLEPARMVDEERVTLLGVPWGHVRYFWGEQQYRDTATGYPLDADGKQSNTHFLFQDGATLKRSLFHVRNIVNLGSESSWRLPHGYRRLANQAKELLLVAHYDYILSQQTEDGYVIGETDTSLRNFEVNLEGVGMYRHYPQPKEPIDCGIFAERITGNPECMWNSCSATYERDLREQRDKARKLMADETIRVMGSNAGICEIYDEIQSVKAQMVYYRKRWNDLMDRLRTVEQLFIAT